MLRFSDPSRVSDAELTDMIRLAREDCRRFDRAARVSRYDRSAAVAADAAYGWLMDLVDEAAARDLPDGGVPRDDTRSSDVYVTTTSPWVHRAIHARLAAKPRGSVRREATE